MGNANRAIFSVNNLARAYAWYSHFGYMIFTEISDLLRKKISIIQELTAVKTRKINWVSLSESEKIEVLTQGRIHLQEQVEYAKFCQLLAEFYSIR